MKHIRDIFSSSEDSQQEGMTPVESSDEIHTEIRCNQDQNEYEGSSEETSGKHRMYCPRCYADRFVDSRICPVCGTKLEEPMTEDEEDEMMEILMFTRM